MLQLRVYGESPLMAAAAERLDALPGARHVSLVETRADGAALVAADVRSEAADPALAALAALGVPPGDVALVRLDALALEAGTGEASALIWQTYWTGTFSGARPRAVSRPDGSRPV